MDTEIRESAHTKLTMNVGERGGEWGKQAGSMNEEHKSAVAITTFIYTNQETVSVLEKTQANKTFWTWKQT